MSNLARLRSAIPGAAKPGFAKTKDAIMDLERFGVAYDALFKRILNNSRNVLRPLFLNV